jgi:hypothetical protein
MVKTWNVQLDENDIAILLEQQHQNIERMLAAKAVEKFSPSLKTKTITKPKTKTITKPKTKTKTITKPKTKTKTITKTKSKKATPTQRTAAAAAACNEMLTAKYRPPRKSPPFEADQCQNEMKLGNDQKLYRSVRNEKGEWRWVTALHLALDQEKPPSQRSWFL